ncbi:helix-turn-helix transcriptional regulator [Mycobacterium sp. M1]|uniref:Helix-turn-helix transcriptional regulator n=1 Tax=Mycolicibacter acidiphilus TaxID=2835306 RepID=A0ABS5RJ71_9MYCO|nr:helix-turn-helix transcriptional regulator [Mycolicibacter acidiphilus]MBS9534346.1 helix-turn-helix transcriptional regulator [Mycolicibacter acidiphilus]
MSWFESTPEREAMLAEERLVLSATEIVHEALDRAGVTKRELAARLNVKPSEISQRLSGRRNLTFRTFAAMLHKLGMRAELTLRPALPPVGSAATRMVKIDVIPPGTLTMMFGGEIDAEAGDTRVIPTPTLSLETR